MDFIDKQINEKGPAVMSDKDKPCSCFVCKDKIEIGQEYYSIIQNKWMKRHIGCARKSIGKLPTFMQDEDAIRRSQRNTPATGPCRQRIGGHGFTGGSGFKTIHNH